MESYLFVNKSAASRSLSRSEADERQQLYKHAQRGRRKRESVSRRKVKDLQVVAWKPPELDREKPSVKSPRTGSQCSSIEASTPQLLPGPSNNRLAYCERLLGAFVTANVTGLQDQCDYRDIQSFFWIRSLPSLLSQSNNTLWSSIIALAGAGLGEEAKDQVLVHAASTAYTQALAALTSSALSTDDETLAACLALANYQFFANGAGRRDWNVHMVGLRTLLQSRGPESFQQDLPHGLFQCARAVIISSSWHARKATFLAQPAWQTIPWKGRSKSSYEQMLDCLTLLPGLAERFSRLSGAGGESEASERLDLIRDLWKTVDCICCWFETVAASARPLRRVPTGIDGLVEDGPQPRVFPESYDFRSLARSNMFRMFWTSLCDVYNLLSLTYESLALTEADDISVAAGVEQCRACDVHAVQRSDASSPEVYDEPIHTSHYFCTRGASLDCREGGVRFAAPCSCLTLAFACRAFAKRAASEVCLSLQYCLLQQHGIVGKFLGMLPLKWAIWCFVINLPSTTQQLEWCYRVVWMLSRSGVPFSANLLTDTPYHTPVDRTTA